MFRFAETRFWVLLTALALAALSTQCGGPESFRSHVGTGGHGGTSAGLAGSGAAGATGAAGDQTGAAGLPLQGAAGDGPAGAGVAGAGAAGAGVAGAGAAGAGMAGAGAAGAGAAGAGAAGAGAAGATGAAGKGAAGAGAAGAGAAGAGAAGAGAAGAGAAGAGAAGATGMLKVQYECRQNGPSVTQAEYSLKVLNTGTTDIALNTVTVRYWYTIDGSGAQAGTCASAAHPCTIAFQSATPAKATADQYGVISFAGGTLAKGTDTGEIQIVMHGSGNLNQTNDYSFDNTGAVFSDEMHITGYISGKLVWGTPP